MKPAALSIFLLLTAGGCTYPRFHPGEWPTGMPEQSHYERLWEEHPEHKDIQAMEEYLTWVMRFYKGFSVARGWHEVERIMLKEVSPERYPLVRSKMSYLGMLMSGEWARPKTIRKIDTRMLVLWGNLMKVEVRKGPGRMERLLDAVIPDAEALIRGELGEGDIHKKRYQPLLDDAGS